MLRIKRTKTEPATRANPNPATATHYAASVAPRGNIETWTRDPSQAVAITDGVAKRVQAFYAGRSNAGEIKFEKVDVTASQLASAVAADDAIGAAEFAALQKEIRRLSGRNVELEIQAEGSEKAAAAAVAREREMATKLSDLEAAFAEKSDEVATLKAKLADMESALDEATRPVTT